MKKLIKNKFFKIAMLILLLTLLISIRSFERKLFYDPFLVFFKLDYHSKPLPDFEGFKLFRSIFSRFFLNMLLSALIIYLLFENEMYVKIATVLYMILFVILSSILFYTLLFSKNPDYLMLFYIRRFLIQPILPLFLIPAFYFQKLTTK